MRLSSIFPNRILSCVEHCSLVLHFVMDGAACRNCRGCTWFEKLFFWHVAHKPQLDGNCNLTFTKHHQEWTRQWSSWPEPVKSLLGICARGKTVVAAQVPLKGHCAVAFRDAFCTWTVYVEILLVADKKQVIIFFRKSYMWILLSVPMSLYCCSFLIAFAFNHLYSVYYCSSVLFIIYKIEVSVIH